MSGIIENTVEPFFNRLIPKIPGFGMLGKPGELRCAFIHIWFHLAVTLIAVSMALAWSRYIGFGALISFFMVIIAELPPNGRRIDILTRGIGTMFGLMAGLKIALGAYLLSFLGMGICAIAATILYFKLPKDKL